MNRHLWIIFGLALASPVCAQTDQPESEVGDTPAPAPPMDHAADAIFDPVSMAAARNTLRHEAGRMTSYSVVFNGVEAGEIRALYSRALDPWFNLQVGVRHDFEPGQPRSYASVGFEGLAPYLVKLEGALFLSDKGDVLARLEGSYDERITQRLILQPRAELNFAAQDVPANGIGSGLSSAELGLRLRYEVRREFAPYVGISWEGKLGDSARFARAAGDGVRATSLVFGVRAWF